MFRIFFAHRTEDADRVRELQKQLKESAPNLPFVDAATEVPSCEDWKTIASTVIGNCDVLVCVVGSSTYESEPVDWEVREAHLMKVPTLVARLSSDHQLPPCCIDLGLEVVEWDAAEVAGQIAEVLLSKTLFLHHDWSAGEPDVATLLGQYDLMVQSWEALISRRQTVNTLYVSADTAILAGIGVLVSSVEQTGSGWGAAGIGLLAFLGMALSLNWRRTIASYGTLSRAKSKVVAALEAHLPAQLFDAEWRVLEAKRYRSTTATDSQTALFFSLLFATLAILAIGFAVGQVL